jgi:hypothetical protein
MPSRSAVHSAGRYDLHHAIMSHGGYLETGQELDRRPSWPPSQHLDRWLAGCLPLTALPCSVALVAGMIRAPASSCLQCALAACLLALLPCSLSTLRQELRGFLTETRLVRNRMPTASQLLDSGRADIYQARLNRPSSQLYHLAQQLSHCTTRL